MEIRYGVTGEKRKDLVAAIERATGAERVYMRAPTYAFEVDYFTVSKDGTLTFNDRSDTVEVEKVLEEIAAAGFEVISHDGVQQGSEDSDSGAKTEQAEQADRLDVNVALPKAGFTEMALKNLRRLTSSKQTLIKKALGADELLIKVTDEQVIFPWFRSADAQTHDASVDFITALCEKAKNAKKTTAKEKPVPNEKYAFRCFLLRLGLIGPEFKQTRKILLRNFTGSSAFRDKAAKKESPESEGDSELRDTDECKGL